MSEENIKPWEMFGGAATEQTDATGGDFKPWEFFSEQRRQQYGPTLRERAAIRDSFIEDPLACVPQERRAAIEAILQSDPESAEEKKKRIALSRYYSTNHPEAADFIFDNLEAAIEQFEGKPMSVEQAFASVQQIYQPKQEKGILENRVVAAVIEGEGEIAKQTFNVAAFIAGLFAGYFEKGSDLKYGDDEEYWEDKLISRAGVENAIRGVYKKHYEPIREWAAENMDLPGDWMTNSDSLGDWLANAGISIINYAPQLAAQIGLAGTGVGAAGVGSVYGIGAYYEARDEHGMSEAKSLLYGAGIGLINGLLEQVTLGIVEGKVSEKVAKEGIKKGLFGLLKHFGFAAAKEGAEEAIEEVAENILDMAMGITDTTDFSASDYAREMFKGVPEAAFLGAVTGAPLAIDSYRDLRKVAEENERARTKVRAIIGELSGKDVLTEDEQRELSLLNAIQDSGDPIKAKEAARELGFMEEARQAEAETAAEEEDEELTDEEREARDQQRDIENENRGAKNGENSYRYRHNKEVDWNRQDTIDRVKDVMMQFPAFEYSAVWSSDMLPDFAQRELKARGIDPNKVQGFILGNTVYVVADNVRPSEVTRVIGHEIIGHRGIRAVFGQEFDDFLDSVYSKHQADIEKYSELYNTPVDTVDGQRYLTEEFLADMADAKTKPTWWKEFIAGIRAYLHKVIPGEHFTDADIEYALIRSARATRKMRSASGGGKFSLIGTTGASNAQTNTDQLVMAKQMEQEGKDPKSIWLATGWERGTDGQWRMEIPDLNIKGNDREALAHYDGTLDGYIDAPALFEAYPEMREYKVQIEQLNPHVSGWFDPENNIITINGNRLEQIEFGLDLSNETDMKTYKDGIRGILIHEVQHAIQHIEGFARGTNTNDTPISDDPVYLRQYRQYDDAMEEIIGIERKLGQDDIFDTVESWFSPDNYGISIGTIEQYARDFIEQRTDDPSIQDEFVKNASDAWLAKRLMSALEKDTLDRYHRHAGEVEARNAEYRSVLSDETRKQRPPSDTEDVPWDNQIVRFRLTGEDKDLIAVHNVGEQKLRDAIKLGALPVPSLGIISAEKSDFTDYGRITLIADKYLIDPKKPKNKVFNADIYSVRRPEIQRNYTEQDFDRALEVIAPHELHESDSHDSIQYIVKKHRSGMTSHDFVDDLKNSDAVRNWYVDTRDGEEKFEDWWIRIAEPELDLHPDERIFDGYTNSGRRRYLPANLETIVRLMTRKVKDSEGFFYGVGNIRANMARQFKSIAEIQANRDKIVSGEDYKKIKDEVTQEFNELLDHIIAAIEGNRISRSYDAAADLLRAMAEGPGKPQNREWLTEAFGTQNPIYQEMADFLLKLRDLPTPLFEAKPQRAVYLNEFKAAVVPESTANDILNALRDAGVEVYTYASDDARKATLQYVTNERDLRFNIEDYSADDQRDIVAMMKPKYRAAAFVEPSEAKKFLESKGVEGISENDAWSFYMRAGSEIKAKDSERAKERRKEYEKRRDKWMYETDNIWRWTVDALGGKTDIKIIPSSRYFGEKFNGTFIADNWLKYGEKRKQGDKKSDKSYAKYMRKREEALKSLKGGKASDELAKEIANKYGLDEIDLEQQIIDYFRDLNWKEIDKKFKKWKDDEAFRDAEAEREAREAYEANRIEEQEAELDDAAIDLIQRGEPITEEWAVANMDVFNRAYKILMNEEPPKSAKPSKMNLEAMNKALTQTGETDVTPDDRVKTYMAAYKEAREESWNQFKKQIADLKRSVMQNKADALKLQRQAIEFAEKELPKEFRSEFTRAIVGLLDYATSPSRKYPEGRRLHEFRNLLEKMTEFGNEKRAETGLANIKEMLDAVKVKRNWKGIPTSVIPSEQGRVDRIRKIVDMNAAAVANAIDYNNERISQAEENGENKDLFILDNLLLDMFGNLQYAKPGKVATAEQFLKGIIQGGKAQFKGKLKERRAAVEQMQQRAIDDATGGTNYIPDHEDAKNHLPYSLKNMHLMTLLRIVSGKSLSDFENSIGGELYRKTEDSTQKEMTSLRMLQDDFDDALTKFAGVSGKTKLARIHKKGRALKNLSRIEEKSGVFKTEYEREIFLNDTPVTEGQRRQLVKKNIPVEDYDYMGQKRMGARTLLNKIDNGETVTEWYGFPVDETGVAFLRKQLADFDAGIERSYKIFEDEKDSADLERMIKEERSGGRLLLLSSQSREGKKVEVPLSQGTALQILLTWEQEDYRPNMLWNGWTEESIEQLRKFIKPETRKLGEWMRDYIAKNRDNLDALVYERYGAHLPENENYWPGMFRGNRAEERGGKLSGARSMNITPNFLIARKFHLKPVDMDADAISVFYANQITQAHFLAWSDTIRDLREVYGNTRVQNAINANFGYKVTKNLVERIGTIARNGSADSEEYLQKYIGAFYRYWIPAKIAINQSSILKQMIGSIAYMNKIPVTEFVKGMARANFSNRDYRHFVEWARKSDYMKNRLSGGMDKDLLYLLSNTRDKVAYNPLSDSLLTIFTWGTKAADAWSALHGGYAVYEYALDQARKSGMSETQAQEAARRAWMRATDETQQSGYLKDLNYFQSNQGLIRYFTAFLSNPIQVMNLELQTLNELRYSKVGKGEARKRLARQILTNHLIVPTLMQFTTDMIRYGFDVSDWWDESEWEDYFLAWLFGPFEGAFLVGKEGMNLLNYAADKALGHRTNFGQTTSAIPLLEDIRRDIDIGGKLTDGEITEEDVADGIKAAGDVGMLIGTAYAPAGPVGTALHAIGTQGKRLLKIFKSDEERRK